MIINRYKIQNNGNVYSFVVVWWFSLYSGKRKEQKVEESFITQVEKIILQECGLK